MDTRKVGQEAAGKVLEQARKGQETVTGALKTGASVAQFVAPPLPPSVSSRLPSRDELTANARNLLLVVMFIWLVLPERTSTAVAPSLAATRAATSP